MTKRTVVITGANSYLGHYTVEHLLNSSDCDVFALVSPRWSPDNSGEGSKRLHYLSADLTQPLSPKIQEVLAAADRVFHFAWVRGRDLATVSEANEGMILRLMESMSDPSNFFFFSSVAGSPDALSTYGITKANAARLVGELGGSVLLCGLVVEAKPQRGPYKLLCKTVQTFPLSLRLTRGEPQVFPIHIHDLVATIKVVCETKLDPAIYKLFGDGIGFNKFMVTIENVYPKPRMKVAVSANFILWAAAMLKKSHLAPASLCDKVLTFLHKDADYLMSHHEIPGILMRRCID